MEVRILIWDIETSFNIIASFGIFDQKISPNQILQERSIICAAWKWLGDKKVHHIKIDISDPYNDKEVVKKLHEVLSEADILVAHNGDRFDLRYFNGRAFIHGLEPLPKIPSVDTLKQARKHFNLNSNKLDCIAKHLGFEGKNHMSYQDWIDICWFKCSKALTKMVKYNKKDVTELEKVYLAIRPYMQNHPNVNLVTGKYHSCPSCGSMDLNRRGHRYTRTGKFQQYKCGSCGSWSSTGTANTKVNIR